MERRPFPRSLSPGQIRADEAEDIREEIELYLELRTDELAQQGIDAREARRLAERRFGDVASIEGELRRQARRRRAQQGRLMTMEWLRQDLSFAIRTLRRNPGFALVAMVTLALALGGNTAIFSVVDAALLRALPFEDHEGLVFVNGYHLSNGEVAIRGASYPEFRDWAQRSRGVSPMAAVGSQSLAITGGDQAESITTALVTEGFFDILHVEPIQGRTFVVDEHGQVGSSAVVVLSHGLWQSRFGGSPDAIGQSVVINDQAFTVVGVMPEGFGGIGLNTDAWMPETAATVLGFGGTLDQRTTRYLTVIGRLTTDMERAQAELDMIARDLQEEFPRDHEDRFAQLQGFRDAYLANTGNLLWVLLGAGTFLLLIAAANVSNLLLVRSHGRTREIVLRRALGADRGRVRGQLLTESVVLACLSGVAGLAIAWLGLRVLGPIIPQGVLPGYVTLRLSTSTFLFSFVALALVGLVMGVVPAASAARIDIAPTLREGGRASVGSLRRFRAQHAFVVVQVALALVLMTGAGLLTRSFRAQLAVDTGAELERIVAVRVSLPGSRYPNSDARRAFGAEVQRLASELPGVTSVSISSDLPFRGGSSGAYVYRSDAVDDRIRFHRHMVEPGYFETLGLESVAGRLIDQTDTSDSPRVAVITEAMVRRVFPDENPVGETMFLREGGLLPFEVVGVIEDLRYRDLTTSLFAEGNSPDVFFPFQQLPSGTIELGVTVRGEPASYTSLLREVVAQVDSDLPVFDAQPLLSAYLRQTATPRFAASLMGTFSALAVILACVGIYGVLSFSVGQRAREMAIRRAVGASAPTVARSVIFDGMRLSAVGLGIGAVGALGGSRALEGFLFDIEATDPVTFLSVGGSMLAIALAAAVIPALRAMRRDPAEALSDE